jgi:hypothetical protein
MTLYNQEVATEHRCNSMKNGRENRNHGNQEGKEKGRQEETLNRPTKK